MKTCALCHLEFQEGDKVVADSCETFIFKPAEIPDKVNPARVTPDELRTSRKDYKKTVIGKQFVTYHADTEYPNAFNFRHVVCDVQRTGAMSNQVHPLVKHAIRYNRSFARKR